MDQSNQSKEIVNTKPKNPWLSHVKKVANENPDMTYKDVLRKARETYTKIERPAKKERVKTINQK